MCFTFLEYSVAPSIPETNKTEIPPVSVSESATIFESDVDLKASTNLAANSNKLIGENSVHYVSTEDDDTFIISLNSAIDAKQLTDMLNIGVELKEINHEEKKTSEGAKETIEADIMDYRIDDPIVVKIAKPVMKDAPIDEDNAVAKPNVRKYTFFVCRTCNKVFKKKCNYKSHKATHNPSLRAHCCHLCGLRFSYRSTLNKHVRTHEPQPARQFRCEQSDCKKVYDAVWKLKNHVERDHENLMPFKCDWKKCGKRFYKQDDLRKHQRLHSGERPYSCDSCQRAFRQISHLKRHMRSVDCTKRVQ